MRKDENKNEIKLVPASDRRHFVTKEAKFEATIELLRQPDMSNLYDTIINLLEKTYRNTDKPAAYLIEVSPRMIKKALRKKLIKQGCADEKIMLPTFPMKGIRIHDECDIARVSERIKNIIQEVDKHAVLPPCNLKIVFYRLKDLTRFLEGGALDGNGWN